MATDHEMREWARANGYQVGERGRLPERVIDAYHIAHPDNVNPNGTCSDCFQPKWASHREWCKFYVSTNAEVHAVTVAPTIELPTTYCSECWQDRTAHEATCSFYVPPVVADPVPVLPEVAETPENTPNDQEATITALIRSIAATAVTAAPAVDAEEVRAIVREEIKATEEALMAMVAEVSAPKVFNIHIPARETVTMDGPTHADFEKVVKIVGVGLHAYLVGPPGTGKTTLAGQVAEALGLQFGVVQCDPTMPASKLFGFIDANGSYRGTVFRDRYENGGVFLFDEIDNAHPGIIASINGAIANGHCAFPDGMVKRNVDFRCVAAANTFGTGATRAFVGRNQLDAATLDRFVTVEVGIDETLEEALTLGAFPENVALAKEWLVKVRAWRKGLGDLQVIISPRASTEGAKLLSVGFSMDEAADMKVWKGIDKGTRAKIERGY
jgi:cobaltochelatase CobS